MHTTKSTRPEQNSNTLVELRESRVQRESGAACTQSPSAVCSAKTNAGHHPRPIFLREGYAEATACLSFIFLQGPKILEYRPQKCGQRLIGDRRAGRPPTRSPAVGTLFECCPRGVGGGSREGGVGSAGSGEGAGHRARHAAQRVSAGAPRQLGGGQVDDDEFTIGLGSVGQREDSLKNRGGLIGGRRLSDPGVPTKLAYLSVKGAGLAIALVSVQFIAQGFVGASPVSSGIGDADTGADRVRVGAGWCC
jgi:hypothetical protein